MATSTSDAAMILRNCVKIEQLADPLPPVEAILRRCNKAQVHCGALFFNPPLCMLLYGAISHCHIYLCTDHGALRSARLSHCVGVLVVAC